MLSVISKWWAMKLNYLCVPYIKLPLRRETSSWWCFKFGIYQWMFFFNRTSKSMGEVTLQFMVPEVSRWLVTLFILTGVSKWLGSLPILYRDGRWPSTLPFFSQESIDDCLNWRFFQGLADDWLLLLFCTSQQITGYIYCLYVIFEQGTFCNMYTFFSCNCYA